MSDELDHCEYKQLNDDDVVIYECYKASRVLIDASCDSGHDIPASFCDDHARELLAYYDEDSRITMTCDLCYSIDELVSFTQIDEVTTIGGTTPDKLADASFPRAWLRGETP